MMAMMLAMMLAVMTSMMVTMVTMLAMLAMMAAMLAMRIAAKLRDVTFDACPIHGDFDTDQVLFTSEGVAILDFDEAAQGDPVADLGSFAARLEWAALRGDLSAGRAKVLTENLLEGYCRAAHCDLPAHFDLYKAAGLLRVAPHPFRNRLPDWPEQTQAIFDRIESIMVVNS